MILQMKKISNTEGTGKVDWIYSFSRGVGTLRNHL